MCAHGLLERDGPRYAYRLTNQGVVKGAIFLVLFQQCLCGLLAHSLFRHRPDRTHCFHTKLEAAFHKAPTQFARSSNSWAQREIFLELLFLNAERVRN